MSRVGQVANESWHLRYYYFFKHLFLFARAWCHNLGHPGRIKTFSYTYCWLKRDAGSQLHFLRWSRLGDPVKAEVNGLRLDRGGDQLVRELEAIVFANPAEEVDGGDVQNLGNTGVD